MVVSGFVVEGLSLVYRGKGEVSSRDAFLLKNGGVEYLLPLYFCREGEGYVFVYDLDGGYSVGDLAVRGDGSFTITDMVSILERVEYLRDEYFFDLRCFYLNVESLVYSLADSGCGIVYCPLYRGDFFGSLLSLVGELFSSESWFMDYLTRLEALGKDYTLQAYIGVLRLFAGVGGKAEDSNGAGKSRSMKSRGTNDGTKERCVRNVMSRVSQLPYSRDGAGDENGFSSSSFSVLSGGRSFGYGDGSSSSSSTSSGSFSVFSFLSSGFDWWGLFVGFIGGGVGNIGCVVLLFLFGGFVLGLFF